MSSILFTLGDRPIDTGTAVAAGAGLVLCLLLALLLLAFRQAAARRRAEWQAAEQARELEARIADLLKVQSEMTGRMQTMAEVFGSRQGDLMRAVNDRLDGMSHKLGQSMAETSRRTHDGLRHLHERLAVIDRAQRTIADLSGQVGALQSILSDKQTRGAFGQGRMEAIVQDALPSGAYAFQATLSSNARPDCLITMPNGAPPLVVDAKFPLEAYNLIRAADTPEAQKPARAQFRRDIAKHLIDIKERYLIPGETQDTAFMFVPSESIFAELHEQFPDLVQRAHRIRVVIVSPSLLALSIQVVQSVLRDARMREEAHLIQAQVAHLVEDVTRLDGRVRKLHSHFGQAAKDIDQILISTDKIGKRGQAIGELDLAPPTATAPARPTATATATAEATPGMEAREMDGAAAGPAPMPTES
ncbi:DNA recombination protein RmuC [Stappia taiwanensis]|uniref:DNA recombination protein RmuC homolog n=1 Tax=Stappia taiwanensis TaxID=992267 RepID=A0A838XVX3_9HYPH|nr:DNA recombination protein RmuC [Stappia taiwanensis]MBA4612758.1 DNA recombination protein RmuC [Stappia taiwanensis]GGE90289.1 DNA recombinase [Stappia taiwanensis]